MMARRASMAAVFFGGLTHIGLVVEASLAAGLVEARATDVADPFDDIMVAVVQLALKHLQEAHLEA